jgi:lipoate-protein ligase B
VRNLLRQMGLGTNRRVRKIHHGSKEQEEEIVMSQSESEAKNYFRQRSLLAYFLPQLAWEDVLAFQQRLVFDISEEPRQKGALILGEHSPIVTVGRQGSHQHLRHEEMEIATGQVAVKWTNRGGGCWHQQPGQLVAYPILPLSPDSFGLAPYRDSLYQTIVAVLREFEIDAVADRRTASVTVGGRPIASVGIAVKQWVSYHGCVINVGIPLDRRPLVSGGGDDRQGGTCMFRELRTPVRVGTVREAFLRHFVGIFGFGHYYLSSPPASLVRPQRGIHASVSPSYH